MKVLQWFNPFVWFIVRDLRSIHEYEADQAVIQKGIDAKSYQQLLVTKVVGNRLQPFANNLGHGSLKKRILMMYQKPSKQWLMLKALCAIPVVVLAVTAFAIPRKTNSAGNAPGVVTGQVEIMPESIPRDTVYSIVEELPQYPGGQEALMRLLMRNMRYPKIAMEMGVEGRLMVNFIVRKDGTCSGFKVIKESINPTSLSAAEVVACQPDSVQSDKESGKTAEEQLAEAKQALEDEAIRVCRLMEKWIPGRQHGKDVSVSFTLPVVFRLSKSTP